MAFQKKEKSKYEGLTLVKNLVFNPVTKKVVKKPGFNGNYPEITTKDIEDVLSVYSGKELEYRKDKSFEKAVKKKVQKPTVEELEPEPETGSV